MPFFKQEIDDRYKRNRYWCEVNLTMLPSEYYERNCKVGVVNDHDIRLASSPAVSSERLDELRVSDVMRGEEVLPIWVGIFEANATAQQLEEVVSPRPMTPDLLKNVIEAKHIPTAKMVSQSAYMADRQVPPPRKSNSPLNTLMNASGNKKSEANIAVAKPTPPILPVKVRNQSRR